MQWSFIAIIEVWLSGLLSLISISLIFIRILLSIPDPRIEFSCGFIKEMGPILTITFCSIAYTLGWIINHVAENIFDPLFQHKYRKKLGIQKGIDFFVVRANVFQYGSENTINDIKYDRQVIRISRANCLNFFILSIVVALYFNTDYLPLKLNIFIFLMCLMASSVSFWQWTCRYKSTYCKFYQAYNALQGKKIYY